MRNLTKNETHAIAGGEWTNMEIILSTGLSGSVAGAVLGSIYFIACAEGRDYVLAVILGTGFGGFGHVLGLAAGGAYVLYSRHVDK